MPFDPANPANNFPLAAAEMRSQRTALNSDIQQRATQGQLAGEIGGTSANSNGVGNLSLGVSDPPTQGEVQRAAQGEGDTAVPAVIGRTGEDACATMKAPGHARRAR